MTRPVTPPPVSRLQRVWFSIIELAGLVGITLIVGLAVLSWIIWPPEDTE